MRPVKVLLALRCYCLRLYLCKSSAFNGDVALFGMQEACQDGYHPTAGARNAVARLTCISYRLGIGDTDRMNASSLFPFCRP